jgi:hypothetical protein
MTIWGDDKFIFKVTPKIAQVFVYSTVFHGLHSLHSLERVEFLNDKFQRTSKEEIVAYFKVMTHHLARGTAEQEETEPFFNLEFEPGTFPISSCNHYTEVAAGA